MMSSIKIDDDVNAEDGRPFEEQDVPRQFGGKPARSLILRLRVLLVSGSELLQFEGELGYSS